MWGISGWRDERTEGLKSLRFPAPEVTTFADKHSRFERKATKPPHLALNPHVDVDKRALLPEADHDALLISIKTPPQHQ